jgi:hypothetical protein
MKALFQTQLKREKEEKARKIETATNKKNRKKKKKRRKREKRKESAVPYINENPQEKIDNIESMKSGIAYLPLC